MCNGSNNNILIPNLENNISGTENLRIKIKML